MKRILLASAALILGLAGPGLAQGPPFSGTPTITYAPSTVTVAPGQELAIDVLIDVTAMTGRNCYGNQIPLIVGAYQIPMEFDRTRLSLIGFEDSPVAGNPSCPAGRPDPFGLPHAINLVDANSSGFALFSRGNSNDQAIPTGGPFCYFRIRMRSHPTNRGIAPAVVRFRSALGFAYGISSGHLICGPGPNVGLDHIPPSNPDVVVALATTPVTLSSFRAD